MSGFDQIISKVLADKNITYNGIENSEREKQITEGIEEVHAEFERRLRLRLTDDVLTLIRSESKISNQPDKFMEQVLLNMASYIYKDIAAETIKKEGLSETEVAKIRQWTTELAK